MTHHILIVDDDINEVRILQQFLEKQLDCKVTLAEHGRYAIDCLTGSRNSAYDLVILDLCMPGISGIDVLQAIRPVHPKLPVIVRTGKSGSKEAVAALKAGATDFIAKTDDSHTVERVVKTSLVSSNLQREMARFRTGNAKNTGFSDILGESAQVSAMVKCAKKASSSDIPVLISGESGVGKELIARAIHSNSSRSDKPFIVVNCSAIPEDLRESVLFGYEEGSFAGAIYRSQGKLREADGGTLFLDEVAGLNEETQIRLLHLLQSGEIFPIGADTPVHSDIRIISSTSHCLEEAVHRGTLREDLFYRINGFPIDIPALRDRHEDIPVLIRYYASKFSQIEEKFVRQLPEETMRLLQEYSWPGNIRQLKNVIYRAVVLSESGILAPECFPQLKEEAKDNMVSQKQFSSGAVKGDISLSLIGSDGHIRSVDDIEKEMITSAMRYYHGCISEIARRLGLGRSTLYRKMRKYNIDQDVYPEDQSTADMSL